MTKLHVFTTPAQPMTIFYDRNVEPPMKFTYSFRRVFYCHKCGRRRWAKNLSIQVYYDGDYVFCSKTTRKRSTEFPFGYGYYCSSE